MAFSAPRTWVTGEIVTASMMNANVRDNINALIPVSAYIATSETTASTTFTDLATVGPSVTIDTGDRTQVTVTLRAEISNNNAAGWAIMSVDVSGASTKSAATNEVGALKYQGQGTASRAIAAASVFKISGLTAGSNTFKAQYKVATGGTGTFLDRTIIVGL